MPVSKIRNRICKQCGVQYTLGVESTQHKYCSVTCRSKWHYNKWKSSGGFRDKNKCRDYWLKHKYNISTAVFTRLLEKQDYRCAICQREDHTGYNWHVDHCHTTDKIRGVLCSRCNQGLGLFSDNLDILQKAKEYLESFTNQN